MAYPIDYDPPLTRREIQLLVSYDGLVRNWRGGIEDIRNGCSLDLNCELLIYGDGGSSLEVLLDPEWAACHGAVWEFDEDEDKWVRLYDDD